MPSTPIYFVNTLTDAHTEQISTLFQQAWWTTGRAAENIALMLKHSDHIFRAVTEDSDTLVGFARVLTDHVYKAIVFDVVIEESYRSAVIGKMLMDAILTHPTLSRVGHTELSCTEE